MEPTAVITGASGGIGQAMVRMLRRRDTGCFAAVFPIRSRWKL